MKNIIALILASICLAASGQVLQYNEFVTAPPSTKIDGQRVTNVIAVTATNISGAALVQISNTTNGIVRNDFSTNANAFVLTLVTNIASSITAASTNLTSLTNLVKAVMTNGTAPGLNINSDSVIISSDGSASFADGKATIDTDGAAGFSDSKVTIGSAGNLVLLQSSFDPDGSASLAAGKTTFAADGSISTGNGSFTVSAIGNVVVGNGLTWGGGSGSALQADGSLTIVSGMASIAANGSASFANGAAVINTDGEGSFANGDVTFSAGGSGSFAGGQATIDSAGNITAISFIGDGSGLTSTVDLTASAGISIITNSSRNFTLSLAPSVPTNRVSIIRTNFLTGTSYSNSYATAINVSAMAASTEAGVVGVTRLDLEITGQVTNTVNQITAIGGLTGGITNAISGYVPAGNLWKFVDRSSGAGNSAVVAGGQIAILP